MLTLNMNNRNTNETFDSMTFATTAELMSFLADDLAEGELTIESVKALTDNSIVIRFADAKNDALDYVVEGITIAEYNRLADLAND